MDLINIYKYLLDKSITSCKCSQILSLSHATLLRHQSPVEVPRVAVPGTAAPGDLLQGRALASPRPRAPAPPPHSLADPAAHTKHYYFNLQVSINKFSLCDNLSTVQWDIKIISMSNTQELTCSCSTSSTRTLGTLAQTP